MPQDLKAQLKQFVPPEPTRIESVETLPPALSRTLLEYGYTSRKRQSTTVELPLSIRETEQVARRDFANRTATGGFGEKLPSVTNLSANKGNTDGDLRRLEDSDYSDWSARQSPAGWDYEYDIGFIKPFAWVMLFHAGKLMELGGKRLALTKAGQKAE